MLAGILIGEERSVNDAVNMTRLAEELGFDSVWFGEHVGIRDALVMSSLALASTKKISVGTCAINVYTRNIGTVLASVNTLDSYYPKRFMLGIASGEEVLNNFGIVKKSPLNEMKEFLLNLKALFSGEIVNYEGSFIKLRQAKGEKKLNVPIYLAATGPKMLSLGSKFADGVILNFLTTYQYVEQAHKIIGNVKSFQLIAAFIEKNNSLETAKEFLSKFFFLAPEFFKSMGISENIILSAKSKIRAWPPEKIELEEASKEIPDEVVKKLIATGKGKEVIKFTKELISPWGSYPIFYIVSEDYAYAIEEISSTMNKNINN